MPPPLLTQPPPRPPTLCHPLLGSPSSLTATPELLIFFTPPKIVSSVPGEPTTFAVSEKQFYRRVTACRCQHDCDKIHGKSRLRFCLPWSLVINDDFSKFLASYQFTTVDVQLTISPRVNVLFHEIENSSLRIPLADLATYTACKSDRRIFEWHGEEALEIRSS